MAATEAGLRVALAHPAKWFAAEEQPLGPDRDGVGGIFERSAGAWFVFRVLCRDVRVSGEEPSAMDGAAVLGIVCVVAGISDFCCGIRCKFRIQEVIAMPAEHARVLPAGAGLRAGRLCGVVVDCLD